MRLPLVNDPNEFSVPNGTQEDGGVKGAGGVSTSFEDGVDAPDASDSLRSSSTANLGRGLWRGKSGDEPSAEDGEDDDMGVRKKEG